MTHAEHEAKLATLMSILSAALKTVPESAAPAAFAAWSQAEVEAVIREHLERALAALARD